MLDLYCRCWESGGLNRASERGSLGFWMALSHLSPHLFPLSPPNRPPEALRSILSSAARGDSTMVNSLPSPFDFSLNSPQKS